jgi:serine/threonine protein phosphatase 1
MLHAVRDRQLIFLGDYINRGPDSRKTLDLLIGIQKRDPLAVFLLGNHEVALLDFLTGSVSFHEFAALGGIPTIRAYMPRAFGDVRSELLQALPDSHRRFLESCGTFFETAEMIVSHCGVDPEDPASRDNCDMVMARHDGLFSKDFEPSKLIVCGHYAQTAGSPYVRGNLICLDTGCGTSGGPLTALLMPERTFLQR